MVIVIRLFLFYDNMIFVTFKWLYVGKYQSISIDDQKFTATIIPLPSQNC